MMLSACSRVKNWFMFISQHVYVKNTQKEKENIKYLCSIMSDGY